MPYRLASLILVLLPMACVTYADRQPNCPRGQQRIDGLCLPSPSIVFTRCVEAFRTRAIEQDRGREVAVAARGPNDVGAQLSHNKVDRERREYAGLSEAHMEAAIGECRRQEEAERNGQLARAWQDAEEARVQAEHARLDAVHAKAELARVQERYDRMQERRDRDDERERDDADAHARALAASLPAPPEEMDAPMHEARGSDEASVAAPSYGANDNVDGSEEAVTTEASDDGDDPGKGGDAAQPTLDPDSHAEPRHPADHNAPEDAYWRM